MMFLLLCIVAVPLLIIFYFKTRPAPCNVPGPKGYPIVGNAFKFFFGDPLHILYEEAKIWGKIYKLYLGPDLFVIITDPVDAEVILSSTKYNSKAISYKFISIWLKDGLITSDGEVWHRHRKLLTPTFHFKILESSVEIMRKHANVLTKQLETQDGGDDFNVQHFIEKCSLDIICETAMSVQINSQTQTDTSYLKAVRKYFKPFTFQSETKNTNRFDIMEEYCDAVHRSISTLLYDQKVHLCSSGNEEGEGVTEITVKRIFQLWMQPEIFYNMSGYASVFDKSLKIIESLSKKVITSERRALENRQDVTEAEQSKPSGTGTKSRTPFLESMLTKCDFTNDEIHDEVMSFTFAGHDTTTSAVSYCIYQLANHPDIQEKAYEEIKTIFVNDDVSPSMEDLNNMKYMECVIKETLRMYPPVPMIGRMLHEAVDLPSGYKLPPRTQVNILTYGMHHDPDLFPEPEKFIPERFENDHKVFHPFAYIPFSAGPRNCIGQKFAMLELKIVLGTLLKKYRILPACNNKPLILSMGLILRSKNGIPVRLVRRGTS